MAHATRRGEAPCSLAVGVGRALLEAKPTGPTLMTREEGARPPAPEPEEEGALVRREAW